MSEYNQADVEFLEAFIETQEDKINGILKFIVEMGIENSLLDYLDEWSMRDNENMCMDYIFEIEESIDDIKKQMHGVV